MRFSGLFTQLLPCQIEVDGSKSCVFKVESVQKKYPRDHQEQPRVEEEEEKKEVASAFLCTAAILTSGRARIGSLLHLMDQKMVDKVLSSVTAERKGS